MTETEHGGDYHGISELEFQKKIKEQIAKELAKTIEVPPFEEQWAKVKAELLKETSKAESEPVPAQSKLNRFRIRKLAWVAVAVMVIGSFSMISPNVANGFMIVFVLDYGHFLSWSSP